jgi:hypothetical protein
MCKSISKSITVSKANRWLDAIVNKAIDIGEVTARCVGYEDVDGVTKIVSYTSYEVSDNLEVMVFPDFIAVTFYGKTKTSWHYHLTVS